jgi:hypothetical protein
MDIDIQNKSKLLNDIDSVRSKLIIIYTFDNFDDTDEFSLNLEMLKLSIATIRRELGIVTINVYTSQLNIMNKLLFELPVNIKSIKREDYISDDIDLTMPEKFKKFSTFTAHVRIFIIDELLKQGHSVLYMDNDTGCIYNHGQNILNTFTYQLTPMAYCYEAQTLQTWLKDTNCHESDNLKRIDLADEFIREHLLDPEQKVINCGVMYFPHNDLSKKIITDIIQYYHLLISKFKFNFGHDQAAITISFKKNLSTIAMTMVDDMNLCGFVHYYREKYMYSDKCAYVLLKERHQLGIEWSSIWNTKSTEILDTYRHSLFNIYNIENDNVIKYNDNYIFYPHLDLYSKSFKFIDDLDLDQNLNINFNVNGFNSNCFSREEICYEYMFKRFESGTNGLYLRKPLCQDIFIPKKIHQICLEPYSKSPGIMKEYSELWKLMNPNWQYIIWTDSDVTDDLLGRYKDIYYFFKEVRIKAKILTYIILYKHGGIYIDLDCRPLKPLNDELLKHENGFAVFANEYYFGARIAHNVLGFTQENFILLGLLEKIRETEQYSLTVLNDYLNMHQEIFVYPSYYFYPQHYYGYKCNSKLIKFTYGIHMWIGQQNKFKLEDDTYITRINQIELELESYQNEISDQEFDNKMNELIDQVDKSNLDVEKKIYYYLTMYEHDCTRYNMLYKVGKLYREDENYNLAYIYLHTGVDYLIKNKDLPLVHDKIRIPSRIKDFDMFDELAIVCYSKGKEYFQEGVNCIHEILKRSSVSVNKVLLDTHINRLKHNLKLMLN